MKKFLFGIIKPFIKKAIVREIHNDEYRDMAIKKLQDRVPTLSGEEHKGKLILIYDTLQDIAEEVVEQKLGKSKRK